MPTTHLYCILKLLHVTLCSWIGDDDDDDDDDDDGDDDIPKL